MGRRVSVILTFFCLLACNNHVVLGRQIPPWVKCLREIIKTVDILPKQKVSCGEMNVTNVFASTKVTALTSSVHLPHPLKHHHHSLVLESDTFEMLCKAAAVVDKTKHCQPRLEIIYVNLRHLIKREPCPVTAANTTTLKLFLEDLKQLTQNIMKNNHGSISR